MPMTQKILELTERLAATVVGVDPGDLQALAQMHSQFQAIEQCVRDLPAAEATALGGVGQAAGQAEKLVERIILQEVDDADAAVRTLGECVSELQKLLATAQSSATDTTEAAPPAAAPQASSAPAPTSAPAPASMPATQSAAAPAAAAPAEHAAHSFALEESSAGINPDDAPLVSEFISEAGGHIESAEAEILKLEDNPQDAEAINAIFRAFHTIKGVAGFLSLKQIGALAHIAENLLDLARHGKLALSSGTVDLILEALDAMKGLVAEVAEALKSGRPVAAQAGLERLLLRLSACAAGQQPPPQTEEAAVSSAGISTAPAAAEAEDKSSSSSSSSASSSATRSATQEATVKVATDRLDNLINTVGELVIAQAMVAQDMAHLTGDNQRLTRNMSHLGKITRELQDLSMSMRMVPIQGVFQKMARLVRDLGRKFAKEIEFSVVGGETELDRNLVEAIGDPLVHMVRNAVDHGIEPPEQRVSAGKPRAGRIELKAYHQAGNIVIEITDDGKGLKKDRILQKAIGAGIVKEGQELSEQEIFRLIFAAGLSTAEQVTDVSGRGVGMDVVRKNVEALRGRIDIASVEGKGSTFTIRLPLTLAVIDGLVVRVGQERFILPITSIEQSLRPKAEQLSTVQNRDEMCMVRGALLPLFRLYRLFSIQPTAEDPTQALVVIVQDNQRRCCLLVDELLGQQQVVIKSLGEGIGAVRGVSGGAILGDGNISLILDVPGIMDLAVK